MIGCRPRTRDVPSSPRSSRAPPNSGYDQQPATNRAPDRSIGVDLSSAHDSYAIIYSRTKCKPILEDVQWAPHTGFDERPRQAELGASCDVTTTAAAKGNLADTYQPDARRRRGAGGRGLSEATRTICRPQWFRAGRPGTPSSLAGELAGEEVLSERATRNVDVQLRGEPS